jgi:5'-nucleotidase
MTLTGAQIDTLLEQQFGNPSGTEPHSAGIARLHLCLERFRPHRQQSGPGSIMLNGVTIDPQRTYRVTVNSFLADGGDNFFVLTQGTNRLGGMVDTDALENYFIANSPVAPGPRDRIKKSKMAVRRPPFWINYGRYTASPTPH